MRNPVSPYLTGGIENKFSQIWAQSRSCWKKEWTDPASCWRRARCQRPEGAGRCERGTTWGWSPAWWTPRSHHRPRPADAPGCPYAGGHQRTSVENVHKEERRRKNIAVKQNWRKDWYAGKINVGGKKTGPSQIKPVMFVFQESEGLMLEGWITVKWNWSKYFKMTPPAQTSEEGGRGRTSSYRAWWLIVLGSNSRFNIWWYDLNMVSNLYLLKHGSDNTSNKKQAMGSNGFHEPFR